MAVLLVFKLQKSALFSSYGLCTFVIMICYVVQQNSVCERNKLRTNPVVCTFVQLCRSSQFANYVQTYAHT